MSKSNNSKPSVPRKTIVSKPPMPKANDMGAVPTFKGLPGGRGK